MDIYLRSQSENNCSVNLMFAKSRLKPKKDITIPRLELLAVTIGINALKFLCANLPIPITQQYLWTDSMCVMDWINSKKKLPVFVENRIKKIRVAKDVKIRYAKTDHNPADLATRSSMLTDLAPMWWTGPDWLKKPNSEWPTWDIHEIDYKEPIIDFPDVLHEASLAGTEHESSFPVDPCKFSTLTRLHRTVAWYLRFVKKLQHKAQLDENGKILRATEILSAKQMCERWAQSESYTKEKCLIKSGKKNQLIRQLSLYFDLKDTIRCSGRLMNWDLPSDAKYPTLLPPKHQYTKLVIQAVHKQLCHFGTSHTLAQLRFNYWIPLGRRVVKSVLSTCLVFVKWEDGPFKLPTFPQLPSSRVKVNPPFSHIGLDYLGPLYIRSTNRTSRKVWICIFTCLTIRAIHLEIVQDMTAEQFLMCLRRFISRKGRPQQIISDNAPQFKLAKTTMDRVWQKSVLDSKVKSFTSEIGIQWKFIVEVAPWMGGFYERLVGNVKRALKKSLSQILLTYDELNTMVIEVEAVVNKRPLTYVGDDIQSGSALCPSDFLCLNPQQGAFGPDLESDETDDPSYLPTRDSAVQLVDTWIRGQKCLSSFWKAWQTDYLLSLRERSANIVKQPRHLSPKLPEVGQIVLIQEQFQPRGVWKLARIDQLVTSADGKVRSAKLRTSRGKLLNRSLSHLYPLEIENAQSAPSNLVEDDPLPQ